MPKIIACQGSLKATTRTITMAEILTIAIRSILVAVSAFMSFPNLNENMGSSQTNNVHKTKETHMSIHGMAAPNDSGR